MCELASCLRVMLKMGFLLLVPWAAHDKLCSKSCGGEQATGERLSGGRRPGVPQLCPHRHRAPATDPDPPPLTPRAGSETSRAGGGRLSGLGGERGTRLPQPQEHDLPQNHLQVHGVEDSAAGLRRPFQKGLRARRPLPGSRLRAYQEGFPPFPEKRGSRCPSHLYKQWG